HSAAPTCFRILAVLAAVVFWPQVAGAQNRYALVHIENNTKDVTVYYKVRWGTEDWGKEVKLAPGQRFNHWYPYAKENQNRSPTPQITFSTGIGTTGKVKVYDLKAYASPNNTAGGKVYSFERVSENADQIELYDRKQDKQDSPAPQVPNVP